MNSKTAKLINKFSTFNSLNPELIKLNWLKTSKKDRVIFRADMKESLDEGIKVAPETVEMIDRSMQSMREGKRSAPVDFEELAKMKI